MRESAKAAAPISVLGTGIAVWHNLFKVSDMIAKAYPHIEAFLPLIGIFLTVFSVCWLVGIGLDWNKKYTESAISELERFSVEARKQFHPALPMPDLSGKRIPMLMRIAEKHHRWLDSRGPDGGTRLSWQTVRNADDSIELLRLYGFIRAKWKRWQINNRKANKTQ